MPVTGTALVFGAAGFVGRNVCVQLDRAGWRVLAAVRHRPVPAGLPAVPLVPVGDDPAALAAALAKHRPAVLVNAAGALWNVTDEELTEGNVRLVRRLVAALALATAPVRLIHIGSAYEYGRHPGRALLGEALPARPTSRYAQTKLAGTDIITGAVATGRLDATVLRIATSVGPYASRHSLLGGLADQLARSPATLRLPPVAGVRDLVDVRDVADAILAAATAPAVPPVVNVGSGTAVPLTRAVDELVRIAGSAATIVPAPAPPVRRDAGIDGQPLDIRLARQALGWTPARTLDDALRAMWRQAAQFTRTAP